MAAMDLERENRNLANQSDNRRNGANGAGPRNH